MGGEMGQGLRLVCIPPDKQAPTFSIPVNLDTGLSIVLDTNFKR